MKNWQISKIKKPYVTCIFLTLLIIVTGGVAFTYLTTYSFTEDFKNNLTQNVRIYREAGKSKLEITRINQEEYKFPISKEINAFGGINIIDNKKFVILKLDNVRSINTEDIDNKAFNSYQLHEGKTNLIKHIKAVLQLRKDNRWSIEWY